MHDIVMQFHLGRSILYHVDSVEIRILVLFLNRKFFFFFSDMPQKLAPWPDDATPHSFLKVTRATQMSIPYWPCLNLANSNSFIFIYFFACVSFPWKFEPLLQGGERVPIEQNASADMMSNAWSHPALSWELTPKILWTGPPLCRGLHWMGGKKVLKIFQQTTTDHKVLRIIREGDFSVTLTAKFFFFFGAKVKKK
ncbi:hypothetical protein TWF970_002369 [Orbilia oligospora]|uniref:Uncharacterized protein n=1 Tax=Orbilia oligospora TaxID=2813651 RepID=A0A7C8VPN4_ORBOL|nr:hypothetical protein TWF970_002369 [Orbilia oligospora]